MTGSAEIAELFIFLADLYDGENRTNGTETATALRNAVPEISKDWPLTLNQKPGLAQTALEIDPHPQSQIILSALPYLRWGDFSGSIANLKAERFASMQACELLGPTGMIKHNDFRVGIYIQDPHFDYPTRTHSAEETYIALGGVGYWGTNGKKPVRKQTGDIIYHPSMIEHQNITKAEPMIAAWRWSGDISYDNYYAS